MPRARRRRPANDTQLQQFGDELRYWRELRGMSVAELAQRIGKDRRNIYSAEDGHDMVSELVVHRLEDALDTGGVLIARYEAVLVERRRLKLIRATGTSVPVPDRNPGDASSFVSETVPDGTLMTPGQRFTKTWTIRNTGSEPWRGRFLARVGIAAGSGLITTPVRVPIPDTDSGEAVTIAVPCVAHVIEGTSNAAFKMTDDADRLFFPDRYHPGLQVQVTVIRVEQA
jgi:transcriptional regulator with XRE-family HTH domain